MSSSDYGETSTFSGHDVAETQYVANAPWGTVNRINNTISRAWAKLANAHVFTSRASYDNADARSRAASARARREAMLRSHMLREWSDVSLRNDVRMERNSLKEKHRSTCIASEYLHHTIARKSARNHFPFPTQKSICKLNKWQLPSRLEAMGPWQKSF